MISKKHRILIISAEAWRDEDNGGNVLSNLFSPLLDEFEFAQIYCSPALPRNNVCKKYFHLSEVDMLHSVWKWKKFGSVIDYATDSTPINDSSINELNQYKRHKWEVLYTIRDFLWRISRWKTAALKQFILDFNPDIIFAPMYGAVYMHRIDCYVAKLTGKQLISYVSDDHLTFRQHSWSPIFWLNRLRLHHQVIKTAQYYSLLYTMTKEQKDEYEPVLKVPMKILKKAKDFQQPTFQTQVHSPIRLIYGGNLSGNRSRTLSKIKEALSKINQNTIIAQLVIYTQTPITPKIRKMLDDNRNSFLYGKISSKELAHQYQESDILLHVESFERRPRLQTRLSFSTKIIDLIAACRCVVAICWSESSPYKYLSQNNIGFCIENEEEIESKLSYLFSHPQILNEYAHRAWDFGCKYHHSALVTAELRNDLKNKLYEV